MTGAGPGTLPVGSVGRCLLSPQLLIVPPLVLKINALAANVLLQAVIVAPATLCNAAVPLLASVLLVTSTTDPRPFRPLWLIPGFAKPITELVTVKREPFCALIPLPAFQIRRFVKSPLTAPTVVL